MKKGWEVKNLGEVLKLEYGKPLPNSKRKPDGAYPVYGANGEKDRTDEFYYDKPSIIVGRKGSAGEINLTENRFWPLDVTYFVTFDHNNHDLRFIYYLLINLELPKLAKGVKPGINRNEVYAINSFIPPLPEQKRIVAILDEAFDAIAIAKKNSEKNLQNARELFESYLENVFANPGEGWEKKKLGEICKIQDGTHFSPKNDQYGKYKYITAKNIKPYSIDLKNITFVSEEKHREIFSKCSVKKGDILYIKDGATAGIATVNTLDEEFSLLSSVAVISCGEQILNTFLVHYMNSLIGRRNFLGHIDGAAITRLTLVKLNNIIVPMTLVHEQKNIAKKLDAISAETKKLEDIYQKKLADLEELKKSILQKAFEGELTDWQVCKHLLT